MGLFHHHHSSSSSNHTCPSHAVSEDETSNLVGNLSFYHFNMIISGASTVLACLIILALMIRHTLHFSNPIEQTRVMRISSLVPVYSIFSFLAVCFPAGYVDFTAWPDPVEGVALYCFFLLLCEFMATDDEQRMQLLAAQQIKKRFSKKPPMDGLTWFKRTYFAIVQYPFVALACTVITCITQAAGVYCLDSKKPYFAHIWITIIKNLSLSIAVPCVLKFYMQLKKEMEGRRAFAKLCAFKLIVGLTFAESILFTILRTAGILKATSVMTYTDITVGLPEMIICIQMVPLALFFHYAYSVSPYSNSPGLLRKRYEPVDGGDTEIKFPVKYQGGILGVNAWLMFFNPVDLVREFQYPIALLRMVGTGGADHEILTTEMQTERYEGL
ncbi:DUF300-domain-containing protein [Aspergillus heteromorphus CBS 117.55]|uniref:DUF300-domain-containing protein n=1 Tax=Aspergillus heteromorphus CBS 117.55 TaxID=1448321 RepID=A0A317X104_9EURO|nr:DUF300-domain-containing protein [Aspergillus heteromorphus CBS 117.55]PWY92324.1 DUF300-domain-containing protein [Aspergillus heteromorphus CBS 117.55]